MDAKLFYTPLEDRIGFFDVELDGVDLASEETLETSVAISLFTDRRALGDDELPHDADSRRGWWADTVPPVVNDKIGSRLWLLSREKTTQETLNRAQEFCYEALQWLLDDGIARRVQVDTSYLGEKAFGVMLIDIIIWKLDGSDERFNLFWSHLEPIGDFKPCPAEVGMGAMLGILAEDSTNIIKENEGNLVVE